MPHPGDALGRLGGKPKCPNPEEPPLIRYERKTRNQLDYYRCPILDAVKNDPTTAQ